MGREPGNFLQQTVCVASTGCEHRQQAPPAAGTRFRSCLGDQEGISRARRDLKPFADFR
jgi:hypothetical protein